MKASPRILVLLTGLALVAVWWQSRAPEPTILAFRLGQTFEQVVKDSTYPVLERSIRPADNEKRQQMVRADARRKKTFVRTDV